MPSVPDVADGRCAKILVPLLGFLVGPSPRSPAVDKAIVFLVVVLSMAYVSGVIVEHFAGVILPYLHLAAPSAPAFVLLLFALVAAWLLIIVVLLAAFVFLGAGMRGIGLGFSWNVLS